MIAGNGFSQAVGFSTTNSKIGITASGSGTPPSNGTTDAAISVSVPNGAIPFSTSTTQCAVNIRGTANVDNIVLAHDQPLTVNVDFVYISGPYDGSYYKDVNGVKRQNTRNVDGSIATDSRLVYDPSHLGHDPWRASAPLTAYPVGQNYGYTWNADYGVFDNAGPTQNNFTNYSVYKSDDVSGNGPFPSTTATVSVNAPGSDVGSNTYTTRWHHQWENWQKDKAKATSDFNKILKPISTTGLPLVGSGIGGITATYSYYGVDVDGLTSAGKLVASGGAGFLTANPIYTGLLWIMVIKLDDLNAAIKKATTTARSITGMNVFIAGIDQKGDLLTFYRDKSGNSINMLSVFGINKNSPYGTIQNTANAFTMVSTSLSVQVQQTYFIADEYGSQGYTGPHSDYVYIFNPGNPVIDCGDFQLNAKPLAASGF